MRNENCHRRGGGQHHVLLGGNLNSRLRLPASVFHKLEFFRRDSLNWMSKDLTELISGECRPGDLNGAFCTSRF